MLKIAVCDDDKNELRHICAILDAYIAERSQSISYRAFLSATEMLAHAKKDAYNFYLLDVLMPALNGMETAREIRSFNQAAKIAFLTSSPEFAIESYSVKACNYLLKPVTKEKLFFALDDVLENAETEQRQAIVVKSGEGIQKLLLSKLIYAEALDRRVIYHMASGREVECVSAFSDVCTELMKYGQFIRPHRSYLVNMSYIDIIKDTEILLQMDCSVPMARRRTAEIKERYLEFQMEEI